MSGPSHGTPWYRLAWSGKLQRDVARLRDLAIQRGAFAEFASAFQIIEHRLKTDPVDFGEPKNNFPSMRMVGYVAIVPPLIIRYGVHDELPLVVPRSIMALPRSVLEE